MKYSEFNGRSNKKINSNLITLYVTLSSIIQCGILVSIDFCKVNCIDHTTANQIMYMNDIKYIKALINLASESDEQHH